MRFSKAQTQLAARLYLGYAVSVDQFMAKAEKMNKRELACMMHYAEAYLSYDQDAWYAAQCIHENLYSEERPVLSKGWGELISEKAARMKEWIPAELEKRELVKAVNVPRTKKASQKIRL
jgi:hypothetical protein